MVKLRGFVILILSYTEQWWGINIVKMSIRGYQNNLFLIKWGLYKIPKILIKITGRRSKTGDLLFFILKTILHLLSVVSLPFWYFSLYLKLGNFIISIYWTAPQSRYDNSFCNITDRAPAFNYLQDVWNILLACYSHRSDGIYCILEALGPSQIFLSPT